MPNQIIITIIDPRRKRWPSAVHLMRHHHVPPVVAERYRVVRWHFTQGIRRALQGELRG